MNTICPQRLNTLNSRSRAFNALFGCRKSFSPSLLGVKAEGTAITQLLNTLIGLIILSLHPTVLFVTINFTRDIDSTLCCGKYCGAGVFKSLDAKLANFHFHVSTRPLDVLTTCTGSSGQVSIGMSKLAITSLSIDTVWSAVSLHTPLVTISLA